MEYDRSINHQLSICRFIDYFNSMMWSVRVKWIYSNNIYSNFVLDSNDLFDRSINRSIQNLLIDIPIATRHVGFYVSTEKNERGQFRNGNDRKMIGIVFTSSSHVSISTYVHESLAHARFCSESVCTSSREEKKRKKKTQRQRRERESEKKKYNA